MKEDQEKSKKKNRDEYTETCSSIISGVISFFILLLVVVFPLIYHKSYFDILETKYQCYWSIVLGMLSICMVLSIIMMAIDFMEYKGSHVKLLFSHLYPKEWKNTFFTADLSVLVFWIVLVISTLQSDYVYEAFWGNEGRYTGLFLMTLYVSAYFLISRFWNMKNWLVEAFLCSGVIMCIIGITDYFQLDVLSFRGPGGLNIYQSTQFTSTVGNINTYTAYVALLMALSGALFATSKRRTKMIWYYVCMIISFFAIIMGYSDNAYLAVGALFGLLPLVVFKNRTGIKRYLIMLATFFAVMQMIDWINQAVPEKVIGLDNLFQIIVTSGGLMFAVVALWLAVAGICYYDKKIEKGCVKANPVFVRVWIALIVLVLLALGYAVIDVNLWGNSGRYGVIGEYLVFDDSWGTKRGYIWRKTIELYRGFTPLHKLFGYGPDTFGILTTNEIRQEMIDATSLVFDNAHNEYLQYFITIGPIGLISYIVFLLSSIVRMLRNVDRNPYIVGCCFAVICYNVQAVVNLNLPIATPAMWLLLSIGMSACKVKCER